MAGLEDVTERAPVRRMSVVRGSLSPAPAPAPPEAEAMARAAALAAAKQAGTLLPLQHQVHLTFADVLVLHDEEAARLDVTVTVQGHARAHLDAVGLLAAAAALVCLRQSMNLPGAAVAGLGLVQNVPE